MGSYKIPIQVKRLVHIGSSNIILLVEANRKPAKTMRLLFVVLFVLSLCSSTHSSNCVEKYKRHIGDNIDYVNDVPTWQECGRLCNDDDICTHWTWEHDVSTYVHRCWMHNKEPHFIDDCAFVSGVKTCFE